METKKRNKWLSKIIVIVLIVGCVAVYFCVPSVNKLMNRIFAAFASGDFTVVKEFVASYGAYAAAVSFALMILQSVAAPLPAFLITFANANLFGWWQGAILSWSSAMAGAVLCFYIARILGRDVAEKLTSKAGLQQIDVFFERHGNLSILIARLLPFISFDYVSYAGRSYIYVFLGIFRSYRNRTASGNHRLLLCRWYADRRSKTARNRTSDLICFIRSYRSVQTVI